MSRVVAGRLQSPACPPARGIGGAMAGLLVYLVSVVCLGGCATVAPTPERHGFRQPGEFEPQEAAWLSADPSDPQLMGITAELVDALMPHVKVRLLVADDADLAATRANLAQHGVRVDEIDIVVDSLAMLFMRDAGVYLVDGRGELAVLDLAWSNYGTPAWCQRVYADHPEQLAQCLGYADPTRDGLDRWIGRAGDARVIRSPLVLENSTFEVNGQGVLLISEPLALERNPGLDRDGLERELLRIPGVTHVIWLAEGLAEDPLGIATIEGPYVGLGADGHTDEFVRFADAHTILLASVDEARADEHPVRRLDRERMQRNRAILDAATDQDGVPFRIIEVPMPDVIERPVVLAPREDETSLWNEANFPASEGRTAGEQVLHVAAASYLNFVIANDLVLVPGFVEDGTPAAVQDQARRALELAFPGRTIRFIHATPLNWSGGGPHCATLSEPRRR